MLLTINFAALTSRANKQNIFYKNSINYQPSITKLLSDKSGPLLTVYLSLILVPSYFRSKCYRFSFFCLHDHFISLKEKLSLYIDRFPQLKPLRLLPHTEPLMPLVYLGLLTDSNKTDNDRMTDNRQFD